jgi:hypothetical protein
MKLRSIKTYISIIIAMASIGLPVKRVISEKIKMLFIHLPPDLFSDLLYYPRHSITRDFGHPPPVLLHQPFPVSVISTWEGIPDVKAENTANCPSGR